MWRCRASIFFLEMAVARHKARQWAVGWTAAQGVRFYRGMSVGLLISLAIILATGAVTRPWERDLRNEAKVELARRGGYSSCCMDVMSIIGHGGGLDEIIAFARAKGETEFSPLVSPTNFYIEASADDAMLRRKGGCRLASTP